jgi:osmotically-inducible protein OsmY
MSITSPGTRSDAAIQREVLQELRWDPHVSVSDIGVSVIEGVVTLTGIVENFLTRIAAQNAALRVADVHAVANDIEVRLRGAIERTDSDLALAALYALKWDAAIQTDRLDVTVSHGYVTLKGAVEHLEQRDAAGRAIRRLAGVKGVTNWITVTGRPAAEDINRRITAAFATDSDDVPRVSAEVHGQTVTLKGTAPSFPAKHTAEQAALSAPGIVSVINQIEVVRED